MTTNTNSAQERTASIDLDKGAIRAVFMKHGFTIKEGQTDLKPYVYAAADELIDLARLTSGAPAEPVGHVREDLKNGVWIELEESAIDKLPEGAPVYAKSAGAAAKTEQAPLGSDKYFLQWIHDRLRFVHGENENYDYMHKLRAIIAAMSGSESTPNVASIAAGAGSAQADTKGAALDEAVAYMVRSNNMQHPPSEDCTVPNNGWSEWTPTTKKHGISILENKRNFPGNYWNWEVLPLVHAKPVAPSRAAGQEEASTQTVQEAFAWAAFADNGNVIIWSRQRTVVEPVAAKYGKVVVPVIAYIDGRTAGTAGGAK